MKRHRGAFIPSDVLEQVLKGLPAKSLLRFRCVCKQWRSVIDDPRFVNLHRIASYHHPGGVKFLQGYERCLEHSQQVFYRLVDVDGDPSRTQNRYRCLNSHPIEDDFGDVAQGVEGLVCDGFAVCNPTTRKRFHLPLPPEEMLSSPLSKDRRVSCGLGFDSEASEYKVVHLLWDREALGKKVWIRVLTLGTNNAWRNINTDTVPAEVLELRIGYGVYAQNKIYFPVRTYGYSYRGFLVLWVGEERLQYVAAPVNFERGRTIAFGNTIALVPVINNIFDTRFEVWILCDVQTQKWDCVVYDKQTMLRLTTTNVVCSMDGSTVEVLLEGPAEEGRRARSTFYWDVKRGRTRKGPDYAGRARIYTKHVETLFDPTIVKA